MSNSSFIKGYKLFKDQPEKDNLKFAHETICSWLFDIILETPRPFRLAITRNLGTGKSTIIKTIQERLSSEKKYKIAYVDIWKLDQESSRRSALMKIAKDLGIDKKDITELEENIYGSITELSKARPHKTVIDKLSIGKWVAITGAVSLIIFVLLFLLPIFPHLTLNVGIALITWFIGISIKLVDKTFINVQRTFNRAPLVGAEEFENSLQTILNHKKIAKDNILIIFDNIDRAPYQRTEEILTGISAFFDQENESNGRLMIIVPFAAGEQEQLTNTTIQKFFDAVIPIPELVPEDLTGYTSEMLEKSGWTKDTKTIAELINFGPYQTPREIKHFINKLITRYNLASLMEQNFSDNSGETYLKVGVITDNPVTLAKILICEDLSARFLTTVVENNLTIEDGFQKEKLSSYFEKDSKNLMSFLEATEGLPKQTPISPEPFLYLKGADEVLLIPGVHDLSDAITEKNVQKIKDYQKANENYEENIDGVLKYTFKRYKNNNQRIKNAITTVLKSLSNVQSRKLRQTISNELIANDNILGDFEISEISKVTPFEDGVIENIEIWNKLDAIFQLRKKEEDGDDVFKDWIVDYLREVIVQPEGIKRALITSQSFTLENLMTVKIHEALGENYPGDFVNQSHITQLLQCAQNNTLAEIVPNELQKHLGRVVQSGINQSSPTITNDIENYIKAVWTQIAQKINTEEFDKAMFQSIIRIFSGIPANDKIPTTVWNHIIPHLNNNYNVFEQKISKGFQAEVLSLFFVIHEKVSLAGQNNIKARVTHYFNSVDISTLTSLTKLLEGWEWANAMKALCLSSFQAVLKKKEILEFLLKNAKGSMAEIIIENVSAFSNIDFADIIDKLKTTSDSTVSQLDIFQYVVGEPSIFMPTIRDEFIRRFDNFKEITDGEKFKSFIEFEISNVKSESRCREIIQWVKDNKKSLFDEIVEASEVIIKNTRSDWNENVFCQFVIFSYGMDEKTDTNLKDIIDMAIERGVKNIPSQDLACGVSNVIIGIWERDRAIDAEKIKLLETSVNKSSCVDVDNKNKIMVRIGDIRKKNKIKDKKE